MIIKLNVPSIACEVCAETITKAIKNEYSEAQVSVDIPNKIVTVETQATKTAIQQVIEAAGHNVED